MLIFKAFQKLGKSGFQSISLKINLKTNRKVRYFMLNDNKLEIVFLLLKCKAFWFLLVLLLATWQILSFNSRHQRFTTRFFFINQFQGKTLISWVKISVKIMKSKDMMRKRCTELTKYLEKILFTNVTFALNHTEPDCNP